MAHSTSSRSSPWIISTVGPERTSRSLPISDDSAGRTASTLRGSGCSARRWMRSTISISMRGGSSIGSPMYQDR